MNIQQATVDEIPLVWYEPEGLEKRQLVIWLAGFSSDKDTGIREAETIAKAGFLVLSFDPDQHGDRMDNTVEELRESFGALAVTAAERIIRRSLDESAHREIINEVLEESDAQERSS